MGFIAWMISGALVGVRISGLVNRSIRMANLESVFIGIMRVLGGWITDPCLVSVGKPMKFVPVV